MRNKFVTCALAGALGLTGVAAVALVQPAVSFAATGDTSALDERVASIKDALEGLVSDGSISQAQADEVAGVLAEKHLGGRGGHPGRGGRHDLAAVTEQLGITAEELRAAAEAGSTLAELAEQQDVSQDRLVDALVAAQEARLAEAVEAGRLTQAEADERSAAAEARITDMLDEPLRHGHRGHRGGHFRGHGGDAPADAPTDAPSTAPESDEA